MHDDPVTSSLARSTRVLTHSLTTGTRYVQKTLGFTGAGVGVAVIDSGITGWHDDLTDGSTTFTPYSKLRPYGNQRLAAFVDLVNGQAMRSCVTPIEGLAGAEITTLEGLGTADKPHPLQRAFIGEQAAQCGYCINGMIMSAKALLDRNPRPSENDVRQALAANLCRCGTHNRIVRAVLRAANEIGRT